jgi:hypothetical protein
MMVLRYTLVADGSSDRCLLRIIDWVLDNAAPLTPLRVVSQSADLRQLKKPPAVLADKIREALRLYPCDILFIHRDAERESREHRVAEIQRVIDTTRREIHVPVVPVRMTEAWLLIDEGAIRRAADNPSGAVALTLPPRIQLERQPDPKAMLRNALEAASEKTGRRLGQFRRDLNFRVQRVADLINDFSPLRDLEAFVSFEKDTRSALSEFVQRSEEA